MKKYGFIVIQYIIEREDWLWFQPIDTFFGPHYSPAHVWEYLCEHYTSQELCKVRVDYEWLHFTCYRNILGDPIVNLERITKPIEKQERMMEELKNYIEAQVK